MVKNINIKSGAIILASMLVLAPIANSFSSLKVTIEEPKAPYVIFRDNKTILQRIRYKK